MFTEEEQNKLAQMKTLFKQLEKMYLEFTPEAQEKISDFHNWEGSLPYCIRWGITATDELLAEPKNTKLEG